MRASPSNFDKRDEQFSTNYERPQSKCDHFANKKERLQSNCERFPPKKSSFNQTVIMVPPKIIRNLPNYLSLLSEEIWQEHKIMEN